MPTFTAIALDRLLEPGSTKSMAAVKNGPDSKIERTRSYPVPKPDRTNGVPKPKLDRGTSVPGPKLERRVSAPSSEFNGKINTSMMNTRHHWAQPALYTTPESTPLPDSPSSFPPSPYVVNHKRRGPRLLKSFSEDDVASRKRALDEDKSAENAITAEKEVASLAKDDSFAVGQAISSIGNSDFTCALPSSVKVENMNGVYDANSGSSDFSFAVTSFLKEENTNCVYNVKPGTTDMSNGSTEQISHMKSVTLSVERDHEVDDVVDPEDSISVKSFSDVENPSGIERSMNIGTPIAEFYDAWEELSCESGPQPSAYDIEAELREIRLSFLTEIEKRKQAEEVLDNMQIQWQRIRQQLSLVGLTLPEDPVAAVENEQLDPAQELCQQVYIARLVSSSIGRAIVKAEVEEEMEAQIELKNFEIARLSDRLHYYEAVNREMSQRNQEAVETARRLRQIRKRRHKWVWGSIAAAVTVGATALAWSYLSGGKGSSSSNQSHAQDGNHVSM